MEARNLGTDKGPSKTPILSASRTIDNCITKDESFSDLESLISSSSASGDYRPLETPNFRKQHALMLPPSLLEQLAEPQYAALSGLFPEINRAWFTVDNRIFLWNYKDQSDVVVYDGLDQIILSVGLVRPREGVFVDQVKWLLVLTTPVEIVLLAVTFEDTESSEIMEPNGANGIGYQENGFGSSLGGMATPSANKPKARQWRTPALSAAMGGIQGDLRLNPTKFAVPTDNVNMLKVVGTKKGRIFMTGRDGSLNELLYQPEDGWFSRKCRKLNHTASRLSTFVPSFLRFHTEEALEDVVVDEYRNILYTLSANNNLTMYDLGIDGEKLEKIDEMTSLVKNVKRTATQRFEGMEDSLLQICSMHVVLPAEALNVHLVAITRGGHRLYFSAYRSSISANRFNANTRPKRLTLMHVRFPPPLSDIAPSIASTSNRSTPALDASISFYSQGLLLAAQVIDDNKDALISSAADFSALVNPSRLGSRLALSETPELLDNLDVKVLSFAESPLSQLLPAYVLPLVNTSEIVARNELAQQHSLPPRQLIVLTYSGLYFLEKLRPVEHLKDLLTQSRGGDLPDLRKFFTTYSAEQACAMCLVVATSSMSSNVIYGSHEASSDAAKGSIVTNRASSSRKDLDMVSWATTAFFKLGGRPSMGQTMIDDTAAPVFTRITFSGSHDGFALYLSRLLQPVWSYPIFNVTENGIACRLSRNQYAQLELHLVRLRHFLQQNPHFASLRRAGESGPGGRIERHQRTLHDDPSFDEAMRAEQASLANLHQLLLRCLEAFAFLAIMSEINLSSVQLSRVTKPKIGSFKFKDLVMSSDPEIVRELIQGMTAVYSQLAALDPTTGGAVDELTATLRLQCPSFFSDADKTRLHAMDLLYKAHSPSGHYSWYERTQLLQQALEELKRIPSEVLPSLPEICADFQYLYFFEGVVELSLACAKAIDPTKVVMEWYKAGQRATDTSPKELLPQLENCYQQIIYVLNELYGIDDTGAHRMMPSKAGGAAAGDETAAKEYVKRQELSENDWRQLQARTLKVCRAAQDEVFHIAFYQWYIDRRLTNEMIQQDTPFLETFLRFYCKTPSLRMDLLWQYYLHQGELSKAASILLQLAESRGPDQNLQDRLGHLAQALSLLKASPSDHQLLREVQEKVDVGAVQLKVYAELETVVDQHQRTEAQRQLNYELLTISDLFNQYAKRFGLSESALAILHVSGHQDARLARRLWETMISDHVDQIRSHPPPYNLQPLAETIFNLASEYYPSEYVLPLDFLVDTLEQVACRFPADSSDATWYRGWVANALLRAQIPASILYKIYVQLFEARTTFWIQTEPQFHLVSQIVYILETWLNELPVGLGKPQEVRILRTKVDQAIDKFTSVLEKLSISTAHSAKANQLRHILRTFKSMK